MTEPHSEADLRDRRCHDDFLALVVRWFRMRARMVGWGLFAVLLVGIPWRTEVGIKVLRSSVPVPGLRVRLAADELGRCPDSGSQATTDARGNARFTRWVRLSLLDAFLVRLETDTLCIAQDQTWTAVWASHHSVAPTGSWLRCDLAKQPFRAENGWILHACDHARAERNEP